eukprot:707555_1
MDSQNMSNEMVDQNTIDISAPTSSEQQNSVSDSVIMEDVESKEDGEEAKSNANAEQSVPPSPTPRLMIWKMVLENFKSYAGVREVGPFHKCFSSIVGPNGSGKSNVIDSLLFVFGKKASQIRFKKIAELIHRSEKFPDCLKAKVAIHFQEIIDTDDADSFTVVPNSQFSISREVNRKGTSTYRISGKRAIFAEIGKLLESHGVDLNNNRFLILQGEVESISLMKPKGLTEHETGLLEYLEDIIGSNRYVERIEQSAKLLEELNEKRQESLDRVKVVEKEKDSVESSKTEAEAYLTAQRDLASENAKLHQLYISQFRRSAAEVEEKVSVLNEKMEKDKEKRDSRTKEAEALSKEYDKEKKIFDEIDTSHKKCKAEFASCERRDIKVREDIRHCKDRDKKAKRALKNEKKKLEAFAQAIEAAKEQIPRLEKECEQLTEEQSAEEKKLEEIIKSVKDKTEPIRIEMEAKQKEMIPLKKKVNECQQAVDVAQGELKIYEDKQSSAKEQFSAAKQELKDVDGKVKSKDEDYQQIVTDLDDAKRDLVESKQELDSVSTEERSCAVEITKLRGRFEEARAALRASSQEKGVLGRLMKAKRQGVLPGIEGRLGDLGTIPDKYDVGVSTAGGALNHIVVDTPNTAQRCVEYLKEHNLGRATFLILDKQRHFVEKMRRAVHPPEGVVRLFDQITPIDKKYLPAFYYALQDTLFTEAIDQAVRVANSGGRRWKVVTSNGELVDVSGTMTGGGRRKISGAMSSRAHSQCEYTAEQVSEMEREFMVCQDRYNELKARKRQLANDVRRLESNVQSGEVRSKKAKVDIDSMKKHKSQLSSRLRELKKAMFLSEEETSRVEALESEITEKQKALGHAQKNTEKLQRKCDKLKEQIMEAGGLRVRTQQTQLKSVTDKLSVINRSITELKVDSESASKNTGKSEKKVVALEKELEELKEEFQKHKDALNELEEQASKVLDTSNELETQKREKMKILHQMDTEYKRLDSEIKSVRSVLVDIEDQLIDFKKVLKEKEDKAGHWKGKLDQAIDKINKTNKILHEISNDLPPTVDEDEKKQPDGEEKDETAMDTSEDHPPQPSDPKAEASPSGEGGQAPSGEGGQAPSGEGGQAPSGEGGQAASGPSVAGYKLLTEDELAWLDKGEVERKIMRLDTQLKQMNPDMGAIEEFRRKLMEYSKRVGTLDEITKQRDDTRADYDGLRKKRLDEFIAGFSIITMKLKEMYQMLTLGGDAELELVDTLNPFSEGIEFSVRPPKKSWKKIQNLSGGEKTLSSLALVFALHHFKPTPLYVMDEIDAALDFKNVSIVANYIKDRTKNAQFIIISLRNNMFELANRLVGIYKITDASESITIDPDKFAVPASNTLPPATVSMSQPLQPKPVASRSIGSVPASQPVRTVSALNRPSTVSNGLPGGHPRVDKHAASVALSQTSVTDENNGHASQGVDSPAKKRMRTS